MIKRITPVFFLFALLIPAHSQDAQWRGPDRDGKYKDTGLLKEWPKDGPELILKVENLGGGYSTPVMYEDLIYITGRKDSLEYLYAIDLEGEIIFQTLTGKAWMQSFQESRNTPVIDEGKVYIAATRGTVNCIDAKSGQLIWSSNPHEEYGGEFHRWGTAESLLLYDDAVLTSPSGEETVMVALDKTNGSLLWKSGKAAGGRSYVSPLLIEHNGIELILATTSRELVGINPADGEVFWQFDLLPFTTRGRRNNTNTPIYKDGEIFFSSGYDDTAIMLSLSDDCRSVSVKYTSDVLDNHHGGMVLVDGYLYGANWISNGKGNWVCMEWESGEIRFEETWINKGSIIWADGLFYLFEEKLGNVGLFELSPEGMVIKGSFIVRDGRGPRWAHPSIYNGKLLIRHHDVLLVYELRG